MKPDSSGNFVHTSRAAPGTEAGRIELARADAPPLHNARGVMLALAGELTPLPGHLEPGCLTAVGTNIAYRFGKLRKLRLLQVRGSTAAAEREIHARVGYLGYHTDGRYRPGEGPPCDGSGHRDAIVVSRQLLLRVLRSLAFRDVSFDGVFLNEVLEHVRDETKTLRELHRVLRPRGYLALMSPNHWFPFEGHGVRVAGCR